jgi:hypothetical protein
MHRSLEDFEQKLKEFFDRHDPDKKSISHAIAKHFLNHRTKYLSTFLICIMRKKEFTLQKTQFSTHRLALAQEQPLTSVQV